RSLIVSTSMLYVIMSYPPCPTLFPYTTLFRSQDAQRAGVADHPGGEALRIDGLHHPGNHDRANRDDRGRRRTRDRGEQHAGEHRDRKSTRLNSSHVKISYAVFCLKKKKKKGQK